jgi:hypothetical protein
MIAYSRNMDPTYENFAAECPCCGASNIFNRASDLQTFEPIAFRTVKCQTCKLAFNINGDSVDAAHQMFLSECFALIERKQYMQCILSVAQAYEVFFSHFLHVQLVYRAFAQDNSHDLKRLNGIIRQLYKRVKCLGFDQLRHLVLRTIVDKVAPASLTDAEAAVGALPKRREIVPVPRETIEVMSDTLLKALPLRLLDADVNKLRNRVVHKDAYRPKFTEAKRAHDQAREILLGLTGRLRLQYDVDWYIGAAGR